MSDGFVHTATVAERIAAVKAAIGAAASEAEVSLIDGLSDVAAIKFPGCQTIYANVCQAAQDVTIHVPHWATDGIEVF